MNRKVKEIETMLEERNKELELMAARISELNAKLEEYRTREASIAYAITEAHSTKTRILEEAQTSLDAAANEAARTKKTAEDEARRIREKARRDAQSYLDKMKAEASIVLVNARNDAAKINDDAQKRVNDAEAKVKKHEEYCNYLDKIMLDASKKLYAFITELKSDEQAANGQGVGAIIKTGDSFPEKYSDSRELYHNIMKLDGRVPPAEDEKDENDSSPNDISESMGEGFAPAEPEIIFEDCTNPLDIEDEIAGAIAGVNSILSDDNDDAELIKPLIVDALD